MLPPDRSRPGAWAGIAGPTLFVTVFTIEGWLRPGYRPASMFISALSLGPRGWIQMANFVVVGLAFLLFARGVATEFKEGRAARLGSTLLTIIGCCFVLSGPFVMDPITVPAAEMSLHSKLHYAFGALAVTLGPVSCFPFALRFRHDRKWRSFLWWTLAVGTIMTAAVVLLSVGPTRAPAPPNAYNAWAGVIQRMIVIPYMAWVVTFGLGLLRWTKTQARPPTSHPNREPAIDRNRRPGHEIRRLTGQERGHARHVARHPPPPFRRALLHTFVQSGHLLPRPLRQIGIDPPRQHRVDLDVVPGPGGGERTGHLHDAAFGAGVGCRVGRAEQRHHRPDVDHLAAADFRHRVVRRLRAQESARQVGVHDVIPFLLGEVLRHFPN